VLRGRDQWPIIAIVNYMENQDPPLDQAIIHPSCNWRHTVVDVDTRWQLAANHVDDPDQLQVGQVLVLRRSTRTQRIQRTPNRRPQPPVNATKALRRVAGVQPGQRMTGAGVGTSTTPKFVRNAVW
jgi:hypothetical protein